MWRESSMTRYETAFKFIRGPEIVEIIGRSIRTILPKIIWFMVLLAVIYVEKKMSVWNKNKRQIFKLVSRANRAYDQLTESTCEFACFSSLHIICSQDQITSSLHVFASGQIAIPPSQATRNRSQLMPQCLVSFICKCSVWSAVSSFVRGHFSIEASWVECFTQIWVRMIGISSVFFVSVAYHLYDWTIWQRGQPGIEGMKSIHIALNWFQIYKFLYTTSGFVLWLES